MKITTKLITTLREATGAGLLACKTALKEAEGNIEAAIESMKKAGQVLAERKSDRATSEGLIVIHTTSDQKSAVILEVNCETDFVAGNEAFQAFVNQAAEIALREKVNNSDDLLNHSFASEQTVEQARQALVAKVGENIQLRRVTFVMTSHQLGHYVHKGKYGCIVEIKGGNADVAKSLAVHVVVSNPKDSNELMQQEFYKEPSKTIEQYLENQSAGLLQYIHFVLGKSAEEIN